MPGRNYVGHELMVPNLGDYHVIEWMDNAKMLVRNEGGVELLSNICRHRQATMLEGRGNAKNIVCPLHRWTYKTDGELIGAPHFPQQSLPAPEQDAAAKLERPAVRRQARHRQGSGDHARVQGDRLLRLHAGSRGSGRIQLQLEDFHRGLSGGLPRRAVPPRPGPARQLRRSASGRSANSSACRPWASTTRCASRQPGL